MERVADGPDAPKFDLATLLRSLTKRRRIAHVQLQPLLNGVQRVSLDELMRLDRCQYEPYLICPSTGPLTEAAEACGVHCLLADRLVRRLSPWNDFWAFWQLYRLMREHRFAIVHTHSWKTGVLGRLAARAAGVPCSVHTVHGFACSSTRSRLLKALYFGLEWLGARLCDMLVCLNHADLDFAQLWLGRAPERLSRIPNGINVNLFSPLDAAERAAVRREVLGLSEEELAVGMVAKLTPPKNPLGFIEAAEQVLAGGVAARFFLIGNGKLRPLLEEEIHRRNLEGRVVLLGWRHDLPQLLGALDLFVLTSHCEGHPLAILEALACGVPVVASDIPGNREAVTEDIDGLLIPSGDTRRFAAAILRLLTQPELRRRFGEAGRQIVATRHDLDLRVTRVEKLYAELVKQASGG